MNKSSIGSTIATPTNLHFPSLSSLSPLPLLISPFDSSDDNTVFTSSGGALYMLPTENKNFAVNSRSTYKRNHMKNYQIYQTVTLKYTTCNSLSELWSFYPAGFLINASLKEFGYDINL